MVVILFIYAGFLWFGVLLLVVIVCVVSLGLMWLWFVIVLISSFLYFDFTVWLISSWCGLLIVLLVCCLWLFDLVTFCLNSVTFYLGGIYCLVACWLCCLVSFCLLLLWVVGCCLFASYLYLLCCFDWWVVLTLVVFGCFWRLLVLGCLELFGCYGYLLCFAWVACVCVGLAFFMLFNSVGTLVTGLYVVLDLAFWVVGWFYLFWWFNCLCFIWLSLGGCYVLWFVLFVFVWCVICLFVVNII